ncbi:MAG: hypothetical protein ACI9SB_000178 [Candidatus Azotimanducaceae bacterium]|jgi:hypothetical protein
MGIIQSLICTCKLHGVDPYTYLVEYCNGLACILPVMWPPCHLDYGKEILLIHPCDLIYIGESMTVWNERLLCSHPKD